MMIRKKRLKTSFIIVLVLMLCGAVPVQAQEFFHSQKYKFRVVEVVGGLAYPWSVAFLPDGEQLITERDGRLWLVRDGHKQEVRGLPEIRVKGQGGLLDVALDPDFEKNRTIYFSFVAPDGRRDMTTAVVRAQLQDHVLADVKEIFRARPSNNEGYHFGSRLVFGTDGTLYITLGDRHERKWPQDLASHYGSVIRINPDGSVPEDNPFVSRENMLPEIYSYGHRNPQGLVRHPETGKIWLHEHGPRGGDEVNIIEAGKNYGWPLATHGREYYGPKIGKLHVPGTVPPLKYWTPSIAPSGMAFYTGDQFPDWQGSLFVGALVQTHISRLILDEERVIAEERLLEDWGQRIRDVRQGPDGYLYILTDSDAGGLYRLESMVQ